MLNGWQLNDDLSTAAVIGDGDNWSANTKLLIDISTCWYGTSTLCYMWESRVAMARRGQSQLRRARHPSQIDKTSHPFNQECYFVLPLTKQEFIWFEALHGEVYLVCDTTMCVSTWQVEFVLRELSCFIQLQRRFIKLFERLLSSEKNWAAC